MRSKITSEPPIFSKHSYRTPNLVQSICYKIDITYTESLIFEISKRIFKDPTLLSGFGLMKCQKFDFYYIIDG